MVPAVSIIIPVHDTEQYLSECIQSALGQSLHDIEVVCVDDGSTDGSPQILRDFAAGDERITIVTQPNRGLGAARNAGIMRARGEYLCFLDSDDHLSPDALTFLHAKASADSLDVLSFGAVPFCDDDELEVRQERLTAYYRRNSDYKGVMTGGELMAMMLDNGDYKPSSCLQLVRTEFLREEGITFKEGILHEDNLFSFVCALSARRVAYTPETLYQRRVRANSITTSEKSIAHFEGYFVTYLEMLRLLLKSKLDERTANAAGRITAKMYQEAQMTLEALPREVQESIAPVDDTPEALIGLDGLQRHAAQSIRLHMVESRLKAMQAKLDSSQRELKRIRSSRAYRLMAAVRRIVRFGR